MKPSLLFILLTVISFTSAAQTSRYSIFSKQRVQNTAPTPSSKLSPSNELYRQQLQAEQEEYRRTALMCIQQTKEYHAAAEHPLAMAAGWHDATLVCEAIWFCGKRSVYVDEQGKITKSRQDSSTAGGEIENGTKVKEGKAMYTLSHPETGQTMYCTVYFL